MKDTIIKNNGKSRIVKAPSDMPDPFDAWRSQLIEGKAYLDVIMNTETSGTNVGCDKIGTPLNKETLLKSSTQNGLGLESEDSTIDEALQKLSVDYVIDVGSSNGWSYRKWKSGIKECWSNIVINIDLKSTGTGLWKSSHTIDFIAGFFTSIPVMTVGNIQAYNNWAIGGATSKDAGEVSYYQTNSNGNNENRRVQIYVIGE